MGFRFSWRALLNEREAHAFALFLCHHPSFSSSSNIYAAMMLFSPSRGSCANSGHRLATKSTTYVMLSSSSGVATSIKAVQKADAKVDRVEPDPLISLAEIASRTGLTRSAMTHYSKGARGKNFPAPIAKVTSESPLWDWLRLHAGCSKMIRWTKKRHSKLKL